MTVAKASNIFSLRSLAEGSQAQNFLTDPRMKHYMKSLLLIEKLRFVSGWHMLCEKSSENELK